MPNSIFHNISIFVTSYEIQLYNIYTCILIKKLLPTLMKKLNSNLFKSHSIIFFFKPLNSSSNLFVELQTNTLNLYRKKNPFYLHTFIFVPLGHILDLRKK